MNVTSRTARAVLIPADKNIPASVQHVDPDLDALIDLVAGPVEIVPVRGINAVLICNAHGKSKDLPPNGRATRLLDHYVPGFAKVDLVMGPTVVLGIDPQTGDRIDLPADIELVALRD